MYPNVTHGETEVEKDKGPELGTTSPESLAQALHAPRLPSAEQVSILTDGVGGGATRAPPRGDVA